MVSIVSLITFLLIFIPKKSQSINVMDRYINLQLKKRYGDYNNQPLFLKPFITPHDEPIIYQFSTKDNVPKNLWVNNLKRGWLQK